MSDCKKTKTQIMVDEFIELVGEEEALEFLEKFIKPESIMSDDGKQYVKEKIKEIKGCISTLLYLITSL